MLNKIREHLTTLPALPNVQSVNLIVKVTDTWPPHMTPEAAKIRQITRELLTCIQMSLLCVDSLTGVTLKVMDWTTVDGEPRYQDVSREMIDVVFPELLQKNLI